MFQMKDVKRLAPCRNESNPQARGPPQTRGLRIVLRLGGIASRRNPKKAPSPWLAALYRILYNHSVWTSRFSGLGPRSTICGRFLRLRDAAPVSIRRVQQGLQPTDWKPMVSV